VLLLSSPHFFVIIDLLMRLIVVDRFSLCVASALLPVGLEILSLVYSISRFLFSLDFIFSLYVIAYDGVYQLGIVKLRTDQ